MKKYSITKYSSDKSNNSEEWTSISDIGKKYCKIELTIEDYKKVEDSYVCAILEIVKYMKIESFKVKDVFRWKNLKSEVNNSPLKKRLYTDSMLKIYEKINNDMTIGLVSMSDIIRLELREDIGGLLYVPYRLKIFIGYDFMMGVHSSLPLEDIFENIAKLDLNIYQFK